VASKESLFLACCELVAAGRAEKERAESEVAEGGMGWGCGLLLLLAFFPPQPPLESLLAGQFIIRSWT